MSENEYFQNAIMMIHFKNNYFKGTCLNTNESSQLEFKGFGREEIDRFFIHDFS